jgi:hypothetical protein
MVTNVGAGSCNKVNIGLSKIRVLLISYYLVGFYKCQLFFGEMIYL